MPRLLRRSATTLLVLLGVALGPAVGAADQGDREDETKSESQSTVSHQRPSADEFKDAPAPADATGVDVPEDSGKYAWLWMPRALLFIPRWAFEVAVSPIRGALWLTERYQLTARAKSIFFNDEGNTGAYPLAFFETGFGLNVGGRVIFRDILAEDSKLNLRISYGGRFRQMYGATAESGQLLGDRVQVELLGSFQIFPKSRFNGIGNGDIISPAGVMDVDPLSDDTAVKSRYRHDDIRAEVGAAIKLTDRFGLRLSSAFVHRTFDPDATVTGGEVDIFAAYDTAGLVGYDAGLESLYGEAELTYDSRRPSYFYLSTAAPSAGWKLSGFAGYAYGLDDDPSRFIRYGADVQRYFDLFGGNRVLILRAYLEAVNKDLEQVPFVELPRLGGPVFLRGYSRDRFRDRISTLASAEYQWGASPRISGFAFVDVGRVHRSFSDMDFDDLRVGFGGGIQFHGISAFRLRTFLASSIDGGLFFNLSFDPAFDTSSRKETP